MECPPSTLRLHDVDFVIVELADIRVKRAGVILSAELAVSDVLGLVSNQQTSKPKPWFAETKPNHVHGFKLVLVLV
jgi:hypothetical protein